MLTPSFASFRPTSAAIPNRPGTSRRRAASACLLLTPVVALAAVAMLAVRVLGAPGAPAAPRGPAAAAPAGGPRVVKPTPGPLRATAVQWVAANNAFGPDDQIVEDMTKVIDDHLKVPEDFSITFGAGLMKSGKPTQISGIEGEFFVVEFNDAEAKALNVKKMELGHRAFATDSRRSPGPVVVGAAVFDKGARWDMASPLTGHVSLKPTIKLEPAQYSFRICCNAFGETNVLAYSPITGVPQPLQWDYKLSFWPGEAVVKLAREKKDTGPLVVFFDLCQQKTWPDGRMETRTLTESTCLVFDRVPPAPADVKPDAKPKVK